MAPRKKRTFAFASWLAHHPAVGLMHMLALTRPRKPGQQGHFIEEGLASVHRCGTRCEALVELARASQRIAVLDAPPPHSPYTEKRVALATPRSGQAKASLGPGTLTIHERASLQALEVHVPCHCVSATALDAANGTRVGEVCLHERYSTCGKDEDAVSMALTAIHRLTRQCGVRLENVGLLQLGSASLLDRSKSMKSELTALLEAGGCATAEGVDACSGAAAAVLSCVRWVEGSGWDGRWAVA